MTTPAMPQSIQPTTCNWYYDAAAQVFGSPETGGEQRTRKFGRWRVKMTWDLLEWDQAQPLLAFFNRRGTDEKFTIYHPGRVTTRGHAVSEDGLVDGNSQLGFSLATKSWALADGVVIFEAGDVFSIEGSTEWYEVETQIAASSSTATIPLTNGIRNSPVDGKKIYTGSAALLTVQLDQKVIPEISTPLLYSFSAEMSEALP